MGSVDEDGDDSRERSLREPLLQPTTTSEEDDEIRHPPESERGGEEATAAAVASTGGAESERAEDPTGRRWTRLRRDLRVMRQGGAYLAPRSTGERPTSSTGVPLMRVPSLYASLRDRPAEPEFEQLDGRLRLATEYVRDAMDGKVATLFFTAQ